MDRHSLVEADTHRLGQTLTGEDSRLLVKTGISGDRHSLVGTDIHWSRQTLSSGDRHLLVETDTPGGGKLRHLLVLANIQ